MSKSFNAALKKVKSDSLRADQLFKDTDTFFSNTHKYLKQINSFKKVQRTSK